MSHVKIKKIQEGAFVEDEKKPAQLVVEIKPTAEPDKFIIMVLHPNRQADFTRKVLYEKVHEAKSIDEAVAKANHIKNTEFANTETTYEEVKFIPKWKRGKMKLDLKEDSENKIIETEPVQEKKEVEKKASAKKVAKKSPKNVKKAKKQRKG